MARRALSLSLDSHLLASTERALVVGEGGFADVRVALDVESERLV
jgi:hypothetical protein